MTTQQREVMSRDQPCPCILYHNGRVKQCPCKIHSCAELNGIVSTQREKEIDDLMAVIPPDWAGTIHLGKSEQKKFRKALKTLLQTDHASLLTAIIGEIEAKKITEIIDGGTYVHNAALNECVALIRQHLEV